MRGLSVPVTMRVISPSNSSSFKCLARIFAEIPCESFFNSPKRLDSPAKSRFRIKPFHFPPMRERVSSAGQVNFFSTTLPPRSERLYMATLVPNRDPMETCGIRLPVAPRKLPIGKDVPEWSDGFQNGPKKRD